MKKNLLTTAVSAALVSVLSSAAHADALLGPYFNTIGGANTFVTTITKAFDGVSNGGSITTHWTWIYKTSTAASAACLHADGFGRQTEDDIGTFDLANRTTLFSDTTSSAFYISAGFAGMFTVDDVANATLEHTMVGEALFVDPNTGFFGSYRLVNDPVDQDDGDFENVGWVTHHGVFAQPVITSSRGANGVHALSVSYGNVLNDPVLIWHPFSVLTTSYNVAVVGADMALANVLTRLNQVVQLSGFSTGQTVGLPSTGFIPNNIQGLNFSGTYFNRNENIFSTSVLAPVNCFGALTIANLIDPGSLVNAQNGGWSHLSSQDSTTLSSGVVTYDINQDGDGTPALVANFGAVVAGAGPTTVANATGALNQDFGILVYKAESAGGDAVYTSQNRVDF